MASGPPISGRIGLPPTDTARAFDARQELRATRRWSEMFHGDHARAFTVAKVAKLDLLETIRASLEKVLKEGGTFEQWQADLVPELQKAGWWGHVRNPDLTGVDYNVIVGPRRLRTIFDTNLRVSRAAGLWARIQDRKDIAPFLRYSAVMDGRTRPLHRAWHGTILPVDDPWWHDHFPPNGWNCRCTVVQLSSRQLEANGWKVSPEPPRAGPPRTFYRATGERVIVPSGIDPGFAYNPGAESLRAIGTAAIASLERAAAANLAAARTILRDIADSAAFQSFLEEPGGSFPVAVLSADEAQLIGAQRRVVTLPNGVLRKQRAPERNRGDIGIAEYRRLPTLIQDALVIVEQDGVRLIFFEGMEGKLLKAVVRQDPGVPNPAVVSLHFAQLREIAREARKGRVVLDRRSGS